MPCVIDFSCVFVFGVQIRTIGHTGEGDCICTRDEDGDLEIDDECPVRGHSAAVTRVQFSDDGLQVISGSNDGTVLVSTILRPNPACQSCVLSLMISFAGLASVLTPLVPPDRCASGM